MITAITNTTSRKISGTTYYSDGCLYTTSYNQKTVTTVPYVSTREEQGTYYTTSEKTRTLSSRLGKVTTSFKWDKLVFGDPHMDYYGAKGGVDASVTLEKYWTVSGSTRQSEGFTPLEYYETNSTTESNGFGTFMLSFQNATNDSMSTLTTISMFSNIQYHGTYSNTTYNITFSDKDDFEAYTSEGYGPYGYHSGSTYRGEYGQTVTSFDYCEARDVFASTDTVLDYYTEDGIVTKEYVATSSTVDLYPNETYTISSCFNGFCVSTSKTLLLDTYTNTIDKVGTVPSEVAGLSVQYYLTGTCSTEMDMKNYDPNDERYTTSNYFSVRNQRDKTYLISMVNRDYASMAGRYMMVEYETCYIIPPYYESSIGNQRKAVTAVTTDVTGTRTTTYRTAYADDDYWKNAKLNKYDSQGRLTGVDANEPWYAMSIYEVNGWNKTSWKPILDIYYTGGTESRYQHGVTAYFNDSIKGVTLGKQIYTMSTIVKHWHETKTNGNWADIGWFQDPKSWINQKQYFYNVSNVYTDTVTKEVTFNGYGIMTYDYSYTATTTYNGEATHFVTGE